MGIFLSFGMNITSAERKVSLQRIAAIEGQEAVPITKNLFQVTYVLTSNISTTA